MLIISIFFLVKYNYYSKIGSCLGQDGNVAANTSPKFSVKDERALSSVTKSVPSHFHILFIRSVSSKSSSERY